MIDKQFSESISRAVGLFGTEIINERRLIGIIKDFQGFCQFPPAEVITKVLIETNSMSKLLTARGQSEQDITDVLCRLTHTFSQQYGFANESLIRTFHSILKGMGVAYGGYYDYGYPDKNEFEGCAPSTLRVTETKDKKAVGYHYEAYDDDNDDGDRMYSFKEIRRKLKKIISTKYDIDRRDIENDTMLEELEDISPFGFDMDELITEIEDEFDVFLDSDLFDEFMTINELTKEILDNLDE